MRYRSRLVIEWNTLVVGVSKDSQFWNEGERQRLLDDPWLNEDILEGDGDV